MSDKSLWAVGEGWHPIIEKLEADLESLIPGYTVFQCKEKFGGLRYYIDYPENTSKKSQDTAQGLISDAERRSANTCESCGESGVTRLGAWIQTLCDVCYKGKRQ